jgi:uncharacterized membrane protein YdbT with pleckstrin-like domain
MSYVDRHLLTGETVTYRTHLHWKIYGLPVLLVLVVLVPLTYLAAARSSTPALALLPAGVALIVLAIAWLRRRSSEFAVTNKRVIIKLGVLSTRSIELLLPKIEGIEVLQSFGGRIFGFGEIIVTGSGGTKEMFDGIQSPLDFRQAVQAATESTGR